MLRKPHILSLFSKSFKKFNFTFIAWLFLTRRQYISDKLYLRVYVYLGVIVSSGGWLSKAM